MTVLGSLGTAASHPLPSLNDPLVSEPLVAATNDEPGPHIEIVVVGPGDQFYSLYGHLAVLVWTDDNRNPRQGKLFNFGMTNFTEDGYFGDFVGGQVQFWGGQQSYAKYLRLWTKQDRSIIRYPLNLKPDVARAMYRQLQHDVMPANKYFLYDTFRNNCSTRVRDIVDTYTRGAVYRALATTPVEHSYRHDVRRAYSKRIALLWLTEWYLGYTADQPRTAWELSYRPIYFGEALTKIRHLNGSPLVGPPTLEHARGGPDPTAGWYHWLSTVLVGLSALLFFFGWRSVAWTLRRHAIMTLAVGVPLMALSIGHLSLQLASEWVDARNSLLLLAMCPIDLVVAIGFISSLKQTRPLSDTLRLYLRIRLFIATVVLMLGWVDFGAGPIAPRLMVVSWWFLAFRQPKGVDQ
ncbi:MAG: DUF4105 domain-containing protein [Myxococcota bacterium]|nr:DUF4105 domain-containing protein [Myxococcota bacterium]